MTDEEILQLVKEHFTEGAIHDDGSCSEWYGNTDAFVKFARDIRQDGYSEGYDDGMFQANYNNSWE
jgi:hypothetical protein